MLLDGFAQVQFGSFRSHPHLHVTHLNELNLNQVFPLYIRTHEMNTRKKEVEKYKIMSNCERRKKCHAREGMLVESLAVGTIHSPFLFLVNKKFM